MDANAANPEAPAGLTINDLPLDELLEIFKWIPTEDLDKVQQVCSLWHALIDEWLGTEVTTSSRRIIHPNNPHLMKEGLGIISEIGVSGLYIEADKEPLLENLPSPLPSFKRPHLLRYLELGSRIPPALFDSLTCGAINLSAFGLTLSSLANLRTEHLTPLNFPRLKILGVGIESWWREVPDPPPPQENLRILLKENHFRQLKRLIIRFLVPTINDMETTKFLVPFIQRHRTLEELYVEMALPRHFEPAADVSNDATTTLIREIENYKSFCPFMKQISIKTYHLRSNHPYFQIWEILLNRIGTSLEKISLEVEDFSDDSLRRICSRNGSTLKELVLYQRLHQDVNLDLGMFSPLQCLSTLRIGGNTKGVIGTGHLPQSLENLFFGHAAMLMRAEDVEHILLRMPKLVRIHLWLRIDDEQAAGYDGVSVETLRQFVQTRKVARLDLRWEGGSSDQFPKEGIPNGDPGKPLMLTMCSCESSIHWKLNRNGYYYSYMSLFTGGVLGGVQYHSE